jgi:hypothetical protein
MVNCTGWALITSWKRLPTNPGGRFFARMEVTGLKPRARANHPTQIKLGHYQCFP